MSIYLPSDDSFLLSEILKKEILKLADEKTNIKTLEIGCGSGIQLKTLKEAGLKKENIFSCDINSEAVKHCKTLGFSSVKSDLFKNIKEKFDLIVFNPPYLPEDKREPRDSRVATTGGKKGSEIINKFLQQAKKHLTKDGKIILLTSSLTKGIKWNNYKKKLLGKKKLFFEELKVWELRK
ncbi:methyltransferase [Candidatus Pacearchaeota archaeon]|jgi:release factor glutamine methyltransferase|nr:methyltransferase [Candidatus Pacearchaeota archaeon]